MDIWKQLQKAAVGVGIITIIVVLFQLLLGGLTTTGTSTTASNATATAGSTALGFIPTYFGLIILVVVIALLVGFLIAKLSGLGGNKRE